MSITTEASIEFGAGRRRLSREVSTCLVLGAGLVAAVVVGAGSGQLPIAVHDVLASLAHRVGVGGSAITTPAAAEAVLWDVRMPRLVMAALVGAALGVGGAVMQGMFRNPLAEPAIIGVSAGAAVGACLSIVTGMAVVGVLTTPLFAFAGGVLATCAVYALSLSGGRTDSVTIVLMGVAVNAIAAALLGVMIVVADPQARQDIVFWQLGSLNGIRWRAVLSLLPFVVVGLSASVGLARRLDLLSLGERSATHLGVDVQRTRAAVIVLTSLLVGPAVAFVGIIGFVGLVVPHAIRLVIGPGHRSLVVASMLGGALVLIVADTVARTAIEYAELPIGMLTALVGGPLFLIILRRELARERGVA